MGGWREKNEGKTDDVGMADDRRIQRTEEKSTTKSLLASLEAGTCRKAEHLKKRNSIEYEFIGRLFEMVC